MVGVPGSGKSLTAKACASALGRPLIRLDMGRVYGSFVGESEANMRKCLDIAEAIAPCVLWIDEMEKGLSGNKSGQEGHETTKRVFQELLTWMQDREADVFLVATANSVESLPPELLRAGRIDAIFWVDLPDDVQREEILKIHLKKINRDPAMFEKEMPLLVKACDGFTGAEIEVWLQEALNKSFKSKTQLLLKDMLSEVSAITPISKLSKVEIERAREWAKNRGCRMASMVHTVSENVQKARKLNLN
jgi:SpoVK/Ycf46/Vps4 family AAA+-type ATPase